MAKSNEELMQEFVRAGKIMQHLDGGSRCCHGHGHGEGGRGHGGHGHGHGDCDHEGPEGHKGHGPGEGHGGKCCHGHGHGEGGHGHGPGHGRGGHGQARALSLIAMQEGITQRDLAFLLGIRPQSAGEMLAKLEESGLVERRKSETDARAIQLFLTDEGRARAEQVDRIRKVVAEDVFSVLTEEEKGQLEVIIGKIQGELDKHRPHGHHGRCHGGDEAGDSAEAQPEE